MEPELANNLLMLANATNKLAEAAQMAVGVWIAYLLVRAIKWGFEQIG